MTQGHHEQAALLTGAMALLVMATVFVAGGGMSTVSRALDIAHVSPSFQTAGIVPVYVTFGANPGTVAPGAQSVLSWSTQNADICYIYAQGSVARGIFPPFLSQNSRSGHPVPGAGNLGTGALSTETQFSVTYIMECNNDGSQNQGYSGVIYSNAVTFQPYTYTPPVFTQWFASQSSIAYNTATSLSWSVTPSNRGTTNAVFMYGGPYNATQMSGWTNSVSTGNLTSSTQFQMIATDSYYGNIYSGPLTVTVGSMPVLSISASGSPGEPSTTATYTISRTGSTASAMAFGFGMSGAATRCTSATAGACSGSTDYHLSGTCPLASGGAINTSVPAGSASCSITLTPIDNSTLESTEAATMTLNLTGGGYTLGTSAATLNISDNDAPISDYCSDISGNQTSVPSGCNTPGSVPGVCIPSGGSWNGSSCSSGTTFNFSITVPDKTVVRGTSDTVTVSAMRLAGSAQAIGLFQSYGLPSGVTAGSINTCTPGTSNAPCTSIPLTVSGSATLGTYPISVYAYDYPAGTIEKNDSFNLVVQDSGGFSFSLSPQTSNPSVAPGGTVDVAINASASGSGTVNGFYQSGLDSIAGAQYPDSPGSCVPTSIPNTCTTFSITVPAGTTPGNYPVDVYASGTGGATGNTSFTLTVTGEGAGGGLVVSAGSSGSAGEPGTEFGAATFTLTRSGGENGTALDLPVVYTITGTADYGDDYSFNTGGSSCQDITTVGATIPSGQSSCTIMISPGTDGVPEQTETIILTPTEQAGGGPRP